MCGIVGVFGSDRASTIAYQGLYQLQHRGQDSAGMVSADGAEFHDVRGLGLLREVASPATLRGLPGPAAIGHVRYRTAGTVTAQETQPFTARSKHGLLALAHNGNFPMADAERDRLLAAGVPMTTGSDTEVAVHLLARADGSGLPEVIRNAFSPLVGAYAMVLMTPAAVAGFRDPYGFRPLFWGRLNRGWMFASETCALTHLGATDIGEVAPGQIIVVSDAGPAVHQGWTPKDRKLCAFEKIYITRPDSELDGRDISAVRYRLGRSLAHEQPIQEGADSVVPVLDSGQWAALGFADASGIPYRPAMNRNHYIDRTFIKPEQSMRDLAVTMKHGLSPAWVRGKRVVLVDDSIVRAVTMRRTVELMRRAGALRVHVRISCPPIISPCHYGVDMKTREELYAATHTETETRHYLDADTLGYLSWEGLLETFGDGGGRRHCTSCFTGDYPTEIPR